MARRASKSSSTPMTIAFVAGIIVLIGIIVFVIGGRNNQSSREKVITLPIEDYMTRASQLRDNTYTIDGKVEERFPRGNAELISVIIKSGKEGKEERLPVVVPSTAKTVNIEREQDYTFRIKVSTLHDNKGILVAESVSPIH
ncbi:MAG: hypothetical protein RR553_08760 [Akkermansia sp.]